jgi:hypothetical protein
MASSRSAPFLFAPILLALGCAAGETKPNQAAGGAGAGAGGSAAGAGGAGMGGAGAGGAGAGGMAPISDGGAGAVADAAPEIAPVPLDAAGVPEAPVDVAAEAPPTRTCATSGTELCDDFEGGAIDPKLWTTHTTGMSSLAVDQQHVHGGKFALHVKLAAGAQQTAQLTDAVTFPAKDNTFYTRAWFYFSPDLPADQMGGFHMAFLLATGNNDLGFVEAGLGSAGDKQYLGYSEYYGAGPGVHAHGPTFTEFGPRSSVRIAPATWICLELMQGGDATTTHRRVWVNDKELPEQVSDYKDRKPPRFDAVSIGILQYHPTPLLTDVWIDDVRVGSARIGCGAPPDGGT